MYVARAGDFPAKAFSLLESEDNFQSPIGRPQRRQEFKGMFLTKPFTSLLNWS